MTAAAVPEADTDVLARIARATGGHAVRHLALDDDPTPMPGIRLLEGGRAGRARLCRPAAGASWQDRADFLSVLAALVRAFHSCGLVMGDALPDVRWAPGAPPSPTLLWQDRPPPAPASESRDSVTLDPAGAAAPGRRRPHLRTRAQDRAELARIGSRLLGGPDCPGAIASLIRRAALAEVAAPLPLEWVLALRTVDPGRPNPVPWLGAGMPGTSHAPPAVTGPVRLTLVLLDAGPRPLLGHPSGSTTEDPEGQGHRCVVLAGRHAEQLVRPLHGSGATAVDLPATPTESLEPGPQLEANLYDHAREAALILDADGIELVAIEVRVLGGSRPWLEVDRWSAALQVLLG